MYSRLDLPWRIVRHSDLCDNEIIVCTCLMYIKQMNHEGNFSGNFPNANIPIKDSAYYIIDKHERAWVQMCKRFFLMFFEF